MIESTSRCIACITGTAFRVSGITEDDANNGKLMFFRLAAAAFSFNMRI